MEVGWVLHFNSCSTAWRTSFARKADHGSTGQQEGSPPQSHCREPSRWYAYHGRRDRCPSSWPGLRTSANDSEIGNDRSDAACEVGWIVADFGVETGSQTPMISPSPLRRVPAGGERCPHDHAARSFEVRRSARAATRRAVNAG